MAFNWSPIKEGDAISSAELDTKFSEIKGEINDLPELSIQSHSLHHKHLPSPIGVSVTKEIGTYTHVPYENSYIGWGDDTIAPAKSFASGAPLGWVVITADNSLGPEGPLRVNHSPFDLTVTPGGAYLVLANIQLNLIQSTAARVDHKAFFKIQVETPNGWVSLPTSERYYNSETSTGANSGSLQPMQKDVSIRALYHPDQAAANGNSVGGARVLVATLGSQPGTIVSVTLQHCNLSVIGFYGDIK